MDPHFCCTSQEITIMTEESKSVGIKDTPVNNNSFITIETVTNASEDEQSIRKHEDALVATENIWSPEKSVYNKEPLCLSSECSDIKLNSLEKEIISKDVADLKTDSTLNETDAERNVVFLESTIWKNSNSSPKCESRNSEDNLPTEIKSFDFANELEKRLSTELCGSTSKIKSSDFLMDYIPFENIDYLDKLLDDDSAYGSDESLPSTSPEPTDRKARFHATGHNEMFENSPDCTIYDSENKLKASTFKETISNSLHTKLYLNQDSECICGDSDCAMHKTGPFQEFLLGLFTTKPRNIPQERKKCAICDKEILKKYLLLNRFGLLLNCNHPFCYRCIYSLCYLQKYPFSIFDVECPVCGKFSPGIVSSSRWIQDKNDKFNLFTEMKKAYNEWKRLKSYFNISFI